MSEPTIPTATPTTTVTAEDLEPLLDVDDREPALYEGTPLWPGAAYGRRADNHDGAYVYPGRRVVLVDGRSWPFEPEQCPAGHLETEWLGDGLVLVCRGCGLDST